MPNGYELELLKARFSSKLKGSSSQCFARPKKASFNEVSFGHTFLELFEEAQSTPRHAFLFYC